MHNTINQRITPPHHHQTKRIEYVDSVKGLCITLVVAFHCHLFGYETPLTLLRMPLYFVLSGLFFKDYGSWTSNLLMKTNKLIIPFLFFYSVSYLMFCLTRIAIGGEIDLGYFDFINTGKAFVNSVLWFLLALFASNMLFYPIYKLIHNVWLQGMACVIFSVGVLYLVNSISQRLPLYIDSGIVALPFFWLGYMLRQRNILTLTIPKATQLTIVASCLIIPIIVTDTLGFSNIDLGGVDFKGSLVLYFLMAGSLVIGAIMLFKTIGTVPILSYIGRYSLIILGVHNTFNIYITSFANYLHVETSTNAFCWMQFALSMLLSIAAIPILTRFFPYFTAQRNLINPDAFALKLKGGSI